MLLRRTEQTKHSLIHEEEEEQEEEEETTTIVSSVRTNRLVVLLEKHYVTCAIRNQLLNII
jgi:hypothetical protein